MTRFRPLIAGSVLACAAFILTSCATTGVEGSRHQLYDSVEAMSADSSAIVVGTIGAQEIVDADIPYTLSTLTVEESFSTPTLADNLDLAMEPLSPGQTIEVRQIGSVEIGSVPAPILSTDVSYLLFLAPTMLPAGRNENQFYVTGGGAGIYQADGSGYARLVDDSGDTLPPQLNLSDFE